MALGRIHGATRKLGVHKRIAALSVYVGVSGVMMPAHAATCEMRPSCTPQVRIAARIA